MDMGFAHREKMNQLEYFTSKSTFMIMALEKLESESPGSCCSAVLYHLLLFNLLYKSINSSTKSKCLQKLMVQTYLLRNTASRPSNRLWEVFPLFSISNFNEMTYSPEHKMPSGSQVS